MKVSGIYKITNPNGQVYIGQSTDVDKRLRAYKSVHRVSGQTQIFESLNQYGSEAHQYSTIKSCKCVDLDKWEAYYKQQFIDEHGWDKALFYRIHDPSMHSNHEYLDYIRKKDDRRPKPVIEDSTVNKPKKQVSWYFQSRKLEYDSVYQYDLDGKFISEWGDSELHNVEQKLRHKIVQCARGDANVAFGYQWKSKRCDNIEPYINNSRNAGVSKYKHLFD